MESQPEIYKGATEVSKFSNQLFLLLTCEHEAAFCSPEGDFSGHREQEALFCSPGNSCDAVLERIHNVIGKLPCHHPKRPPATFSGQGENPVSDKDDKILQITVRGDLQLACFSN